ncbi:CysH 3'-phosphoadenosine 5'-phosphosulfate sulfotransferase (PAPS reductase)/FAD synthetase and related enzymes [uncultured Caudovirales phage]|uniref:CysH 3'-phosphoadenosine 5'-phosphosulfate sulfotransferase (PAPS reductase)/FAD synthetase and related enzymes n=1 Tax=uncultured Caudovirales phage TaxID=2100421 RepID=A0A6J5M0Y3_9CAUD|nr:CysH 3'-phosphoadenosine 5'-phosphosulfate sulfotransferase (PAPS reductase)/FAD synthetase and related enzymes [uncultured Caudovirales phage]
MIKKSEEILQNAIREYNPTHIVSMVSGGKDSAASHAVTQELGIKVDLIVHGNTRCGIQETSEYVRDYYGNLGPDFIEADAGTAYEEYVMRKGFFGKGHDAHGMAYRILKAGPFRKAISRHIRKGKRGVRILLINGARKDESANRMKNLQVTKPDPGGKNNIWVNAIHDWSADDRDKFLQENNIPINPVAKALCRSGECMCGTQQSKEARIEAAAIYPRWGKWIDSLEAEVKKKWPWGWGEEMPEYIKAQKRGQYDLFQPMCVGCNQESGA